MCLCLQSIGHCGGLNENDPHGLICLNAWSPLSGTVWGGLTSVALLEQEQPLWSLCFTGGGFEVSKAQSSLPPPTPEDQDLKLTAMLICFLP